MPEYTRRVLNQSRTEVHKLQEDAEHQLRLANVANQTTDSYVLFTVLLASVLFFPRNRRKVRSREGEGRIAYVCCHRAGLSGCPTVCYPGRQGLKRVLILDGFGGFNDGFHSTCRFFVKNI